MSQEWVPHTVVHLCACCAAGDGAARGPSRFDVNILFYDACTWHGQLTRHSAGKSPCCSCDDPGHDPVHWQAELFVVVGTATCCFAMILYVGTLSDERLSTLPFLSGYMLRGVITGAAGTPLNKHKRLFCSHQANRIFMLQYAILLFCQKLHFDVATDCQMLMSCRCGRRVF